MPKNTFGLVNHILPQSYVDGPGNRAVIFLQGCNFQCKYCHNPFTINLCNSCGVCVDFCPEGALCTSNGRVIWTKEKCKGCDICIKACPNFSSPKVTKITAAEVWKAIRDNSSFISGISVSGGEPALQIPFLAELLKLVKTESSLSTLIETNGFTGPDAYIPLLPYLDMALVDLKSVNPRVHQELTSQPLETVLETIQFLYQKGKLYSVQQVIVPGFTDSEESISQTTNVLAAISTDIRLKLLRFRAHGTSGEALFWESPSDECMDLLITLAKSQGITNVTRSL